MTGNKAIKSGIWYTVSNFIVRAIGFITTPIFTRLLTKSEFGEFSNFITWTSIILIVTSLNLESSLIRARYDFEDSLNDYVFSMMILSALSTAVWFVVFLLSGSFFCDAFSMSREEVDAMFLYLLFVPFVNLFQAAERYKFKYKMTVLTSMAISVGSSLLSVVLVIAMPERLRGRIIGYILPTAIIGLIILFYYSIQHSRVHFIYWKYALPFALPFIPHLLAMLLLGGMDKVMINKMCGAEDLALYSLAYSVGSLITILVNSINNAYSPWLGEKLSNEDYKKIKRVSFPYAFTFSLVGSAAVLVTPEVLLIMGGHSYLDAMYVMPPVAAGCIMQFLYCMYVNVEQYEKKTIGMAIASVIAAALNYVLNYIFILKFGYIAAAYTTYIGYLSLLLMHMFLVKRIGMSYVYNNRKILITALIISIVIFLYNFILDKPIVRYFVLSIYCVAIFIFAKKHRSTIKEIIKRK